MEFALDLIKIMSRNNYMLAVRDEFQSILLKPVLTLTERKLNQEPVDAFVRNRVFGAIVECVQNICRTDESSVEKNALLLLSKTDEFYIINAANLVDEITRIKWLAQLDRWSKSPREILKEELLKLKKMSGELDREIMEQMALLDLFIKSEGKITYSCHTAGELFLLEIEIKIAIK